METGQSKEDGETDDHNSGHHNKGSVNIFLIPFVPRY